MHSSRSEIAALQALTASVGGVARCRLAARLADALRAEILAPLEKLQRGGEAHSSATTPIQRV
jgi:hypothetical protein